MPKIALNSRFFNSAKIISQKLVNQKIDSVILNIAYMLLTIGLVVIFSSSYAASKVYSVSSLYFALKHILFCTMSIICMRFFAKKKELIPKIGSVIWAASMFCLVLVLILPTAIKGANRWISIFGFSIQPSEFVKIGIIIEGAKYIEKDWHRFFITYALPMILILIQPDLGNTLIILAIGIAQILITRFNFKYIIYTGIFAVSLLTISYFTFDHVHSRINIFLNPQQDIFGKGYQKHKSLLAMRNGGFLGKGFGKGVIKDFLPDAHTDYVFSVIIEEFGIIGGIFVILLFMLLGLRVMQVLPVNENHALIQYSFVILILSQAWLNIASTLAIIPAKGLTLPLISYGGSSLMTQGIIFGIIMALSKGNSLVKFKIK